MTESVQQQNHFMIGPLVARISQRYGLSVHYLERQLPLTLEALNFKNLELPLGFDDWFEWAKDLVASESNRWCSFEKDKLVFIQAAKSLSDYRSLAQWWRERIGEWVVANPLVLGMESNYTWLTPHTVPSTLEEDLPLSQAYRDLVFAEDFIPPEKKPLVVDYRHCQADFLASVDKVEGVPKMVILDASAQIASHIGGFNGTHLRGVRLHPEAFRNSDYRVGRSPITEALSKRLLDWSGPQLPYVTFVNSGAEANEKALQLALKKSMGKGKKIIAFEGSFHGRSLLTLFSSWNPKKRVPFQLEGYETTFLPFPVLSNPKQEVVTPEGWLAYWEQDILSPCPEDWLKDEQLAREVKILEELHQLGKAGEHFVVNVEPLQCEGGDRYASNRFFQALRLVTRTLGMALIFDEVQSGFGLGGSPLWGHTFELQDSQGAPLSPDFVCLAKKCQVGAVLSCIPDELPTSVHQASALRGFYNSCLVDQEQINPVAKAIAVRLKRLEERFPMLAPTRGQGLCFAFDMPDTESAQGIINQRYPRGIMIYIAGTKTLRFRLQVTSSAETVAVVFDQLEEALSSWKEGKVAEVPDSQYPKPEFLLRVDNRTVATSPIQVIHFLKDSMRRFQVPIESRMGQLWEQAAKELPLVTPLDSHNFEDYAEAIDRIQKSIYEPARQDSIEQLKNYACSSESVCGVALSRGEKPEVLGYFFTIPLSMSQVAGPKGDEERNNPKVMYSADLTVAREAQGRGLGSWMKWHQVQWCYDLGKQAIRSRNRQGATQAMTAINRSFGAVLVDLLPGEYGEQDAVAEYWSLPLNQKEKHSERVVPTPSGIEDPAGSALQEGDWLEWDLQAFNKNSLCNWITPGYVDYACWLKAFLPDGLKHLYTASGRDEAVAKGIKLLIHRAKAKDMKSDKILSFKGSYWGHTMAGARSLSDESFEPYFDWPKIAYPYYEGDPFDEKPLTQCEEACLLDVLENLEKAENGLLGVAIEPIQEATGRRVRVVFLRALRELCTKHQVPLMMNESAAWLYRGSSELFYCSATQVLPDILVTFGGGQLGHVFCQDTLYLGQPLMMVSTWDGDELSMMRLQQEARIIYQAQLGLGQLVNQENDADLFRWSGSVPEGHPLLSEIPSKASLEPGRRVLVPSLPELKAYIREKEEVLHG